MPLNDEDMSAARSVIEKAKHQKPNSIGMVPYNTEILCDLLARQLEVQLLILEAIERMERDKK